MECDYIHLNHNLLVSQKSDHQRCDYKGGLLYIVVVIHHPFKLFSNLQYKIVIWLKKINLIQGIDNV
jgi:hypothetical protein